MFVSLCFVSTNSFENNMTTLTDPTIQHRMLQMEALVYTENLQI